MEIMDTDSKMIPPNSQENSSQVIDDKRNLWRTEKGLFFTYSSYKETIPQSNIEVEVITLKEINSTESCNENTLQCDVCDKIFTTKKKLQKHLYCHTKPFVCNVCNKAFSRADRLETHKTKCTYKCNLCLKSYRCQGSLNRHIQLKHVSDDHPDSDKDVSAEASDNQRDLNGSNYDCKICDKSYTTQYKLNCHKLTDLHVSNAQTKVSSIDKPTDHRRFDYSDCPPKLKQINPIPHRKYDWPELKEIDLSATQLNLYLTHNLNLHDDCPKEITDSATVTDDKNNYGAENDLQSISAGTHNLNLYDDCPKEVMDPLTATDDTNNHGDCPKLKEISPVSITVHGKDKYSGYARLMETDQKSTNTDVTFHDECPNLKEISPVSIGIPKVNYDWPDLKKMDLASISSGTHNINIYEDCPKSKADDKNNSEDSSRLDCHICGKVFIRSHHLEQHIKTHSMDRQFKCSVCKKEFPENNMLSKHMTTTHGLNEKQYACYICGEGFSRRDCLQKHKLTHESADLKYFCGICKKGFKRNNELSLHKAMHDVRYACETCGKEFETGYDLKRHSLSHLHKKSYVCDMCHKEFDKRDTLQKHRITHGVKEIKDDIKKITNGIREIPILLY